MPQARGAKNLLSQAPARLDSAGSQQKRHLKSFPAAIANASPESVRPPVLVGWLDRRKRVTPQAGNVDSLRFAQANAVRNTPVHYFGPRWYCATRLPVAVLIFSTAIG
jgi:hypothetical protein